MKSALVICDQNTNDSVKHMISSKSFIETMVSRFPKLGSGLRVIAAALLVAAPSFAQARNDASVQPNLPAPSTLPAQRIGANDLLNITVYGLPNMSRPVRVTTDGNINLPMIETPIHAQDFLPQELEPIIAKAFKNSDILVDPIVTVTVTEYQSRPITVSGAVKKPLTFQAVGRVTLLDAIARAEGLSVDAGSEVIVTKPALLVPAGTAPSPGWTQQIPVKDLIAGAKPELNLLLVGGEDVRVPEIGKVFVLGNVHKPGAVRVENTADTSVLKVLAMSEGLAPYSSKVAYIYRAGDAGGAKSEIPVEIQKIIDRKQADVQLLANDIFYVPDDKHRRMTVNTIDRIVSFGAGTASGVLIWRH